MLNALRSAHGNGTAALVLLLIPLAAYILLFLAPIGSIISLSVDNSAISSRFEHLVALRSDDPDAQAEALLLDLTQMDKKKLGEVARVLNQSRTGFRSLILETGKNAATIAPTMAGLTAFNPQWGEQIWWDTINDNAAPITWSHYQKVLGLGQDEAGQLVRLPGEDVYLRIMGRTVLITLQVTLLTLLISYPLAYAVANGGRRTAALIMAAVMICFWTSILVRTTAWVVLLQTNGLINGLLLWLRIISEPLQLIFNRFGALVSMTHVLLPFAILPIINVMRTIPTSQSQASRSLGAGGIETFLRVYFPQTLRGVGVAGGTVFILALGFYITPALTGGAQDQMLAFFIADFVNKTLNWGMAAALSVFLLGSVITLVLLAKLGKRFAAKRERNL